jgi:hypothetical protein
MLKVTSGVFSSNDRLSAELRVESGANAAVCRILSENDSKITFIPAIKTVTRIQSLVANCALSPSNILKHTYLATLNPRDACVSRYNRRAKRRIHLKLSGLLAKFSLLGNLKEAANAAT